MTDRRAYASDLIATMAGADVLAERAAAVRPLDVASDFLEHAAIGPRSRR